MQKKIVFLGLVLVVSPFLSYAFSTRIGECAVVTPVSLGVYWNRECTIPVASIQWGLCQRGENKNVTLYFRDELSVNMTGVTLMTNSWEPVSAANYINLTWDYVAPILEPGQVENVTFTLNVNENANISNFSFDIVISFLRMAIVSVPSVSVESVTILSDGTVVNPVPEIPVLLIPPLFVIITLLTAITIRRERRNCQPSN